MWTTPPLEPGEQLVYHQRVTRLSGLMLLACAVTGCSSLPGPRAAPRTADALSLIGDVMMLRAGALGDTLSYDACSVFEAAGRPADFPAGLLPGVVPLLDRAGPDPCSAESPQAGARFPRVVRVDSVRIARASAAVHLSVMRGEWRYREIFLFDPLPAGRGWGFREVRITHPLRIVAPPPRVPPKSGP
jgi:hypothetical protein